MSKERDKQPDRNEYSKKEIDFPKEVEKVLETILPPSLIESTKIIDQSGIKIKQLAYFILFYNWKKPQKLELWITNIIKIKNQKFPHWEVEDDLSFFLQRQNIDPKKYVPYLGGDFIVDHENNRYLQFDFNNLRYIETSQYTEKYELLCQKYNLKAILCQDIHLFDSKICKTNKKRKLTRHIIYQRNENILYGIARENNMTTTEYLRFHLFTTSAQQALEIDASYFDDKTGDVQKIKAHIPVNPTLIAEEIKAS